MITFSNKTIVVPVDLSEQADLALDYALRVADRPEQVHVIHVGASFGAAVDPPFIFPVIEKRLESPYEKSFSDRYNHPKYQGVVLQMKYGDAGHEIAEYARKIGAGLIIMPSHGRSGFSKILLGSVAERVVRFAHCPVLVLRGLAKVKESIKGKEAAQVAVDEDNCSATATSLQAL